MSKKTNEIKLGKRGYKAVVKNKKFNFGDEDWSWFITNTNSGGYGIIVK